MMQLTSLKDRVRQLFTAAMLLLAATLAAAPASASSAAQLERDADAALRSLYAADPNARDLAAHSLAILIFPEVTKAGLMIGGQSGDGVLRVKGRTKAYYNTSAASFGMQAGVQTFSYVLFFVSESSLRYLEKSDGWQVGTGPSVVIVDKGMAKSLTTTTLTQDVYAMIFGQQGLMAGMGIEGSKIRRIRLD